MLLCIVEFIIHWCPPKPFSSSFSFFLKCYFIFLAKEIGVKVQKAGRRGTARWIHHGLAETQGWAGEKNQDKTGVTSLVGKFWAVSWKPVWCHFTCSPWAPFAGAWPGERSVRGASSEWIFWVSHRGDLFYWCATRAIPVTPWCFRVLHAWLCYGLWHELCRVTATCAGTGFPAPENWGCFSMTTQREQLSWIWLLNFCNHHKKPAW